MHDAKIAQREQELKEAEQLHLRESIQLQESQQNNIIPESPGVEVTDSGIVPVEAEAPATTAESESSK